MDKLKGLFGLKKKAAQADDDDDINKMPELTQEQLSAFKETFLLFDADGGGSIDAEELGDVMGALGYSPSPEELAALVKEVDEDEDGEVDFDEFCKMMQMIMASHDALYDLKLAFEVFDQDGSGSISREELREAIFSHGGNLKLSEQEFDEIMNETDTSGDGEVDFQEVSTRRRGGTYSNAPAPR